MLTLSFYAQAIITGDRLILGSTVEQLKSGTVISVNGCSMECGAKILRALGVNPKVSLRLMEDCRGIKNRGRLSDITSEDTSVAVTYISDKLQGLE